MRHFIIAATILLMSANLMGQVDNKKEKRSEEVFSMQRRVYFNIINPLNGNYQLGYEKYLSNGNSILAVVEVIARNSRREHISGYGMGLEYRFTLSQTEKIHHKSHRNITIYLSPFARFRSLDVETSYIDQTNGEGSIAVESYSGGFLVGVNVLWSSRFTMDMFAGMGYQGSKSFGPIGYLNILGGPGYSGLIPAGGIRVGWAFR